MGKLYEIGCSPDETYVYARAFSVSYTAEIALRLAGELVRLGEKLGVSGCLIDIRSTTSVSSVVDKYKFAYEKATDLGLPRNWKYALLKDYDDDSLNFIETVMINAGYLFHVFKVEREAVDWLKEEKSR